MIDIESLKKNAKNIKQKDVCINYLKRSIARAKDWGSIVASYGILKKHMQEVYNIEI